MQSSKLSNSANRYFILSYHTEFDKVNYPIILLYKEIDDIDELKRIIIEMRGRIDIKGITESPSILGEDKTELEYFRADNDRLKQKIQLMENHASFSVKNNDAKLSAVEKEGLYSKIERLEREKEETLAEQKEEIIVLCKKIEQLNTDLHVKNKEISDIRKGKGVRSYANGNIQALTKEVESLKRDLEMHKQKNDGLNKKNKGFEDELKDLKRKLATSNGSGGLRPIRAENSVKNRAFSIKSSSSTINQQKNTNVRKNQSKTSSNVKIQSNPNMTNPNKNTRKPSNPTPDRNYLAINNNFLKRSQSQKSRHTNSRFSFLNASNNSRKSINSFVSRDSKLSKANSISRNLNGSRLKTKILNIDDSFEKRKQKFEEIKQRNTKGRNRGNGMIKAGSDIGKMKLEKFKGFSNRLGELDKLKRN